MISHLGIHGLGVIAAADLDLAPGLVVFTGETGAGKTMLVSALGLVLGDRFDSTLLGPDGTRVQATVDVPADSAALDRVREAGGEVDGTGTVELIIGRHIPATGRGRAVAGGATVPLSVLAEVGETVAQRHSQSDQIGLRSTRVQRLSLDRFAGADAAAALTAYRATYHRYLAAAAELAALTRVDQERGRRLAELRADLALLDEVAPAAGEDDDLAVGIQRLAHAESLGLELGAARQALVDDDTGARAQVAAAAAAVTRAARHDPGTAELAQRLDAIGEQVAELATDLTTALARVSADPGELARLQARKAALTPLLRRFGPTAADAAARADAVRAEIAELDGVDQALADLRRRVAQLLTELSTCAAELTRARRAAALRLAARVTEELAGLAMLNARFEVEVGHRTDAAGLRLPNGSAVAFGESGVDVVRFLLAPHSGAQPAPLGDGASGGELSRIMLALEVVLAESAPPGVFIFDEVDAGIGGRTAVEVGRRLARLAEQSQVLVVTHLPQVASFADQHIVVRKDSDGRVTATSVTEVSGTERTAELSRMLSGQDDSAAARAHADELLDLAAREAGSRRGVPR